LTLILTSMTSFTCLKDGHEEEEGADEDHEDKVEEEDKYRNNRFTSTIFLHIYYEFY
jgi:hypothetical protein